MSLLDLFTGHFTWLQLFVCAAGGFVAGLLHGLRKQVEADARVISDAWRAYMDAQTAMGNALRVLGAPCRDNDCETCSKAMLDAKRILEASHLEGL